ncbi:DoxX family protein [Rhizobium sp. XQZ8]|uniref:DoxX family protein n=1 Tax=Rhizobium populisoli TaxID=2859785 RepID=UPI001C66FE8C|nr:DoxX family protein [Rhizobium populisoli]MBW6424313.1 DoxX family protein [Rhizobium populisoli]
MTSTAHSQIRSTEIGIWVLRVLLGAAFLFFSFMKLSGQLNMVAEFDLVGLGQWFRYFTGALELVGGLAVLVPRFSVFGAILLLVVDLGASVAQVVILHMDWIHCVAIAALLLWLIYLQRAALRAFAR